ncbi:DNA transposase THAP9 [Phyllopteryx taeniolatus]|uniref:DNA transposase THAP9 n=1 Tax=Phyllopteryx taeniolatus TaxID=161469 RepID=UPI002AD2020B|nr:DNA transposase THAP9 [Phyllopteryx taeniolatus]
MMSLKPTKYQKRENPNSDFCCVPQCSMSGKFNSAVSFHHFPKNENLRKIWTRNVRRENLVIKRTTTVCSRHFMPTDVIQGGRRRLKEGAVPVLFAWNDYSQPEVRPSVRERTERPEEEAIEENETNVDLLLRCHDYNARPEVSDLDTAQKIIEAQQLAIEELRKRLEEVTLKQSFGLERFLASDDDIRLYTRFASYRHLQAFWRQIEPATERIVHVGGTCSSTPSATAPLDNSTDLLRRPSRCLPMIDELFLFLMYLSLGLKERDLGNRFNIHQSTVSRIIQTWVNFLYTLLSAVGIWMSPETIRTSMPSVFGKYSDTQVIVDCTRIRCQKPSSLLLSEMFTHYKSHTTLKGMIGVSPHGAVTFVSSLYSGSISDEELFRQSGIIPLLDKDMAVMVDKGFRIDELVPCKVYRPPFLSKKSQMSHDEVLVTQDFARLRIHVERTIRRIKENKLFDTIIPLTLAGSINQLFAVACLLSNYQNKPLVEV